MKFLKEISFLFLATMFVFPATLMSSDNDIKPVTPNASSETVALLKFFHSISSKYTLTGQHNYPNTRSRNSQFAAEYTGKTPVVFSTDWGFAKEGDKDSYLARPDIVKEVKQQHRLGSIIIICWHAVPPTADEPVVFSPPYVTKPPDLLSSVQGQLNDQQFKDLLIPGTPLNKRWCNQVDTIALYLKQLQDAHIPILWRPYHEMNGIWFWWGGRRGEYGTAVLYRQLFDRLVNYHKLNNLIWVWSVDRPKKNDMKYTEYFPGIEYADILSLDVYGNEFVQSYYDQLLDLSEGKPIILAEVGNPPSLDILNSQPKWAAYVIWAGMVRNTRKKQYEELFFDPRLLSREDTAYRSAIAQYRAVCDLTQATSNETAAGVIDFSGEWVLNEETSRLENFGVAFLPYKLTITQDNNLLSLKKTYITEYGDDLITRENVTFDGEECYSEMWNRPRIMKAKWSEKGDVLIIESRVIFSREGQNSQMTVNETWSTQNNGNTLSIQQYSESPWGKRTITMVFEKK